MKRNLMAEMKRYGVTIVEISGYLQISDRTLRNKIDGTTEFEFREAEMIRDKFFPQFKLEYLFHPESAA